MCCSSAHLDIDRDIDIPDELHDGGDLTMTEFGSLERSVMFRCDMRRA